MVLFYGYKYSIIKFKCLTEAVFLVTGVALINYLAFSSFLLSSLPYIFIENLVYTSSFILQEYR